MVSLLLSLSSSLHMATPASFSKVRIMCMYSSLPYPWSRSGCCLLRECILVMSRHVKCSVPISHGRISSIFMVGLAGITPE